MVQGQTRLPVLLRALVAIVIGAAAFGTSAAVAAWCGAAARCIWYVPFAAIGGVLFDLFGAVLSLMVVICLRIFRVQLSPMVLIGMVAVMAALGFAFGRAPGVLGQGP